MSDGHGQVRAAFEGEITGKYKPTRWERFLTGEVCCCPCVACWTFFGIGWLFTGIFVAELLRQGDKLFTFEDQPVKSNVIVQANYAFQEARGTIVGCDDDDHENEQVCRNDEACTWDNISSKCEDFDPCPGPPPLPNTRAIPSSGGGRATWISIIYEAVNDGNILDDNLLTHIYNFERELLTTANGAELKTGEASPWDDNWCQKNYPMGGNGSSGGRCAPVTQLTAMFSVTDQARQVVRNLASQGYSNSPGLASCLCGDAVGLCSVCASGGTVKPMAQWPDAVRDCIMALQEDAGNETSSQSEENAACSQGRSGADPVPMLRGICASEPDCQWAPSGANWLCSSTGYSVGDWQGLVTGSAKDAVLDKVCSDQPGNWRNLKRGVLPQSFDCSARRARFTRTTFVPGMKDYTNTNAYKAFEEDYVKGLSGWYQSAKQLESKIEEESEGALRIIIYSEVTLFSQFLEILLIDAVLSMMSMVLVWSYMWYTLESFFLASCAMFEIVFSLPVAMFLWTILLQQKIIFTQMLVIYMILGIGADDAFILYDAWLQTRHEKPKEDWTTSFTYAYRRSFHAMAITTATTCGSFLIGAASPLPGVRDFCIFAAVVVVVDWLFCVSFFASAVVVYERTFGTFKRKEGEGKKPGECCGPGCCWGGCRVLCLKLCGNRCVDTDAGDSGKPKKRGMERFCEGPLFEFLKKWRIAWIIFWCVLIIAGISSASAALRTAKKRPPVGRENIDAIRGFDILLSEFSIRGAPHVYFVWGLDDEEPAASWDGLKAIPRYGSIGSLATPAGQEELLRLCRAADLGNDAKRTRCDEGRTCLVLGQGETGRCARNEQMWRSQGIYVPDDILCATGRHCFMEDFAEWWAATKDNCKSMDQTSCIAHPGCAWSASQPTACYSTSDPHNYTGMAEADFLQHLHGPNFTAYWNNKDDILRSMGRSFEAEDRAAMTGWKSGDGHSLKLAWVGFNSTIPLENSVEEANNWYDRWEEFKTMHASSLGGFQTTDVYLFMVTQNEMVKAALMGIFLSLLVAFMVLILTTLNWWVAALGLVNISGISIVFLGVMPILGWSLGENECIFLIAVVGLSVDYTVHLLHSYNHHPDGDREDRVRHALAEMGISVTNSAITTLLASVILFGCGFYFFLQFGGFIFFVIGFSILMSITFLIPLLLVGGPNKGQGNVPLFRPKVVPEEA